MNIPPPDLGFRILLGPDTSPRSYNEMRTALDAAHRWMQLYEVPPREVILLWRRVLARHA